MKKVAIIGTGISGMACAYMLQQSGQYDLTVYEKNDYVGGHTRTRTIDYDGTKIAVDTGFIVYNERNYPNLTALFKLLAVPTIASNMTFAVSVADGRLEWGARNLRSVFGQLSNLFSPRFYLMIRDVRRFFRAAPTVLDNPNPLTLGEFLDQLKVGEDFKHYFLLPMGGAIWSCPLDVMMAFPAQTFVRFFQNHGLLGVNDQPQWHTVHGGAAEYVKRLTASFADRIRLNCGAVKVLRRANGVTVADAQGGQADYDYVVFACHGDEALRLIEAPTADEQRVLSCFTYQPNTAYLHRDVRQMPRRKACWGSWVYLSDGQKNSDRLAVTYWMNSLQAIDHSKPLFVTLNPITPIPDHLVFDKAEFDHPVFDTAAVAAQQQLPALQGKNNTWFCGAYHRYGFHEDGLQSAVAVAESMGVAIPWR